MPEIAKDIPEFRDALIAYVHPTEVPEGQNAEVWETIGTRIYASHVTPSPVVQMVQVYDALKPAIGDLDEAGLMLLGGAAFLIHQGQFFGKGPEAYGVLGQVTSALGA